MSTIVCSRPECQTTAGCKCRTAPVMYETDALRQENASLRAQVEELTRERDEWHGMADWHMQTSNAVINEIWGVLGRESGREGGENLLGRIKELAARATAAEAETAEQARLLGMSAERELAMRAEVERLRAAAFQLVTSAKEIDQGNGALNCVVAPYLVRDLRAALSEKSDG